jgi:hypothetical protein
MKRVFYHILVVVAVALVGCGVGRTPRSAAKYFYQSIAAGEYCEALTMTTLSEDADPEIYYAIMEKVSRSIAQKGGVESIEIVEERMADDEQSAVVRTLITYANGEQQEELCDLVRVDESWRVDVSLDAK